MNKFKLVLIVLFISCPLFAEAPEMEKFVPSEWKYMNELNAEETADFKATNQNVFEQISKVSWSKLEERHCPEQTVCFDETKIYKEEITGDTFYWILVPGNRTNVQKSMMKNVSWVTQKHYFLALIRVENNENQLLMVYPTLNIDWDERSCHYYARTYQIIKGKNYNKGIIYYENSLDFDVRTGMIFDDYKKVKNQPVGKVKYALYYKFDNEPVMKNFYEDTYGFIVDNWKSVSITASDFLWDLKNPLKYGLQNTFDQNPATSYVENTDGDDIEIRIDGYIPKKVSKIAIINGYASSMNTYLANNRIKDINLYCKGAKSKYVYKDNEYIFNGNEDQYFKLGKTSTPGVLYGKSYCTIDDKCLDYQFIRLLTDSENSEWFYYPVFGGSEHIYKGEKYNDTCIAEFNLVSSEEWFFGDLDD